MVKPGRRRIYVWYITLIGFCGTYFFMQMIQLGVRHSTPSDVRSGNIDYNYLNAKYALTTLSHNLSTDNESTTTESATTPSTVKPKFSQNEPGKEGELKSKPVKSSESSESSGSPESPFTYKFENRKIVAYKRNMGIITSEKPKPTKIAYSSNAGKEKLPKRDFKATALMPVRNFTGKVSAVKPIKRTKKQNTRRRPRIRKKPISINYLKSIKDPKQFTKIVNPHEFKFLMSPKDLCKNHPKLYILSVIHSAPNNTLNRNTIRQTWGNKSLYSKFRILTLFFLGTSDDENITKRMVNESLTYGDMVIQDYHDSYRNLTYKAMSWMQWTTTYCPTASFVLKTDDDTFVNLVQFTKLIKRYEKALGNKPSKQIICQKRVNHQVFRKKDFKWNVMNSEYTDTIYPPHCPGFAVILGRDVIPVLNNASYYVPFFWIDDVYFTGLLTARTNTRIINISSRYKAMKNSKDLVNGSAIFSYTHRTDERLHSYWKALEDRYHFT